MPAELASAGQGLALICFGLVAAGIVKGATGLGYASCALPFLVVTLGLKAGIALVLVPAMATNIAVALGSGHLATTCRMFWPLYAAMLPGIAIGLALLTSVDPPIAIGLLALTIITYALHGLVRPPLVLEPRSACALQVPVGALNGILAGLTGAQVMPLLPYMMAVRLSVPETVQAINLGVVITSIVLAGGLLLSGVASPELLAVSLAAIPPALIGVEIGRRLRPLIPEHRFRQLVLGVLLGSGIAMLMR